MNFFQEYLEFNERYYKNSFSLTLDHEFNVAFVGSEFLQVTGKTREQTLGKHLHESAQIPEKNKILSKIAFCEAIALKQVKQIFIANLYHTYPGYHILLLKFEPIIEPESQQVVGSRLVFTPTDIAYFFDILIQINGRIEPNDLPDNDDYLTKREHQVAFLLCHCKDNYEIAKVISLTKDKNIQAKTINNIISRYLFPKFQVNNKEELQEKLKTLNYDKKMPNSLLSNQFIDLTKNFTAK